MIQPMSGKKDNHRSVTVGVRIRPLNDSELKSGMIACFAASEDSSCVQQIEAVEGDDLQSGKSWPVDYAFGNNCDNSFIFKTFGAPLVESALEGYNAVMFMYGQTSSGKTFTLFGGGSTEGVVGHTLAYMQAMVDKSEHFEYIIKLSYAELYNEEIKDLLSASPNENLKIVDDPIVGPMIQNITMESFSCAADAQRVLKEGEQRRHFGVTNMNAHSSRSHVLVRLHIEARRVTQKPSAPLRTAWGRDKPTTISTLNLVDLAGSERATKSGTSGQSLKEGSFINKSLLTLGTVISSLTEGKSAQHIPYRDSKLTRLLSAALGGNAKTCMITCISPASGNITESLSTLRFAIRAKKIVNKAQKNEFEDVKSLAMRFATQKAELDELREKFELAKQLGFNADSSEGLTVKSKMISALRNLKSMNFFINFTPKLVKMLQNDGRYDLAKTIYTDLRSVLKGQKDPVQTIEEHFELVHFFFPEEDEIITKLRNLTIVTEEELLDVNKVDDETVSIADDHADMLVSVNDSDFMSKVECAVMANEDALTRHCLVVQQLKRDISDLRNSEIAFRQKISVLEEDNKILSDSISKYSANEEEYKKEIENIRSDMTNLTMSSSESLFQLSKQNEDMKQLISQKSRTIESLQAQLDVLSKDLETSNIKNVTLQTECDEANNLRASFGEELQRTRNDLRTEIEKLRRNMNSILKAGGDETQMLQEQNAELIRQVDDLRNELSVSNSAKNHFSSEISQIKNEKDRLYQSTHDLIEKIGKLTLELLESQEKFQDTDTELARCQGKLAAIDIQLVEIQKRHRLDMAKKEELLTDQSREIMEVAHHKDEEIFKLQGEIFRISEECTILKSELDAKTYTLAKTEEHRSIDLERYEKASSLFNSRLSKLQSEFKNNLERCNQIIFSLHKEKNDLQVKLDFAEAEMEKMKSSFPDFVVNDISRRASFSRASFSDRASRSSIYYPGDLMESDDSYGSDYVRRLSVVNIPRRSLVLAKHDRASSSEQSVSEVSTEYKKIVYEDYLEKRKAYAASVEFDSNLIFMRKATGDSAYEKLTTAFGELSESIESTVKKNFHLKQLLVEVNDDLFAISKENFEKCHGLELLVSAFRFVYDENRRAFDEESENILALESVVDILRSRLHDVQSQLNVLVIRDQLKTDTILKMEKEKGIHSSYVESMKTDLEKFTKDRTELESENDSLRNDLQIALEDIANLEASFDRLYQQASIVQKERNDIVGHFLSRTK